MSAVVISQPSGASIVDALDDDALVEVLRAAKAACVLPDLATTNWKLCTLARSRLPVQLLLEDHEQLFRVTRSRVLAKAPFSGCAQLTMDLRSEGASDMAPRAMCISAQWTALRQLDLSIKQTAVYQLTCGPSPPLDSRLALLLGGLPLLQQLQSVTLEVPAFGARCAGHVAQLVQLTALQVTVSGDPQDTAADLLALSRLIKLEKLTMYNPPVVHPAAAAAAAAAGPFCLPGSLSHLDITEPDTFSSSSSGGAINPVGVSPLACWYTHLPGCPLLHHLTVKYGPRQHPSAHPSNLVSTCAQHNQQLRTLKLRDQDFTTWESLPGLPDAAAEAVGEWHPDAALASLTRLECLHAADVLHISTQADWEVLAQLTALQELGRVRIHCLPPRGAGTSLRLVTLDSCTSYLHTHDLGRLLRSFSALKSAGINVTSAPSAAAEQPAGTQLARHPSLTSLSLSGCYRWGQAGEAAAELGALGGVLSGLSELALWDWRCCASSHLVAADVLPDLSACTGLTGLLFMSCMYISRVPLPQQDAFLSMVRPLSQLRSLHLVGAPHVNARMVGWLQHLLPQLTRVELTVCGVLPDATVAKRRQLLRPDLELIIND